MEGLWKWGPKYGTLESLYGRSFVHEAAKLAVAADSVPITCKDCRAVGELDQLITGKHT